MQALRSVRVGTREHPHDAIETRTWWACFIMDCMVNSGTYSPPMLPMSEMHKLKIARPPGPIEFAFGPDMSSSKVGCLAGSTSEALDLTQS